MDKVKIDGIPIEDYGTPNSRTVYPEENIYSFQESWITEFVKNQDRFIKQECIQHIKDTNKQIRKFKIDEPTLNYIFDLGLAEYQRRMM